MTIIYHNKLDLNVFKWLIRNWKNGLKSFHKHHFGLYERLSGKSWKNTGFWFVIKRSPVRLWASAFYIKTTYISSFFKQPFSVYCLCPFVWESKAPNIALSFKVSSNEDFELPAFSVFPDLWPKCDHNKPYLTVLHCLLMDYR